MKSKEEYSMFDTIGIEHGMKTIGDQMREKARSDRMEIYTKVNMWVSILVLIITTISLIVSVMK